MYILEASQSWLRRLRWFVCPNGRIRGSIWFFLIVLQFGIALLMSARLGSVLLGVGESAEKNTNTYCLPHRINASVGTVLGENYTGIPCAYEYHFQKTIIFWVDGISWDTASPIFDIFADSNIFKVKHKLNPWSAWVFATMMTGKPNRNMGEILNDNLINQFSLAGMKTYLAVEQSKAYVGYSLEEGVERSSSVSFYPGVTNDDDSKPAQMFDWFFRCDEQGTNTTNSCVNNILDGISDSGYSMFLESFYLDHQVHYGAYNKYTEQIHNIIVQFITNIMLVKAWIDEHPDYLLTIISDHGQKTMNSEPGIHGDFTKDGNEGWVLFYNPTIEIVTTTPSAPITLSTVDVLPTLWQFFSSNGVSIAAENVGVISPISFNSQVQYNAYKVNLDQLVAYCTRSKIYKLTSQDSNIIKWAADMPIEAGAVQLKVLLDSLSEIIQENYMSIRPGFPFCVALISLFGSLALQLGLSTHGVINSIRYLGIGIICSVYMAWLLIGLLFENPTSLENRIEVYVYVVSLFAFMAAFISRNLPPKLGQQKKGIGFEQLSTEENAIEMAPTSNKASVSLSIESIESVESGVSCSSSMVLSSDTTLISINNKLVEELDNSSLDYEKNLFAQQNNMQNDPQFLYMQLWTHIKLKQVKNCIEIFLKYIFGIYKLEPSTPESWIMYFVIAFTTLGGIEIAYSNKFFLVANVDSLYKHPNFVKGLGLFTLFLEFRWQRISLTSKLHLPNTKIEQLFTQLFHPSFWLLNIKTIVYFILLVLSCRSNINYHLGFFLYGFFLCHIGILLLCPFHIQRDLVLAVFGLLFYVQTAQERIHMCMYVITMHFVSNTLEKKQHGRQHILPSLLVAMIMLTHFYFAILGKALYDISNVNVQMPGIEDPTKYPIFSVVIMGVHYFGLFLLLVPFIIRLVNTTPPLQPITYKRLKFGHMSIPALSSSTTPKKMLQKQTVTILLFFASSTVALFYFYVLIRSLDDFCTIWAGTILITSLLYTVTIVGSELSNVILLLIRKYL